MDNARSGRLGPRRPHDYFYSVPDHTDTLPDHTDTLPDYTTRARETGERIAVTRPLAHNGRVFWKLTDADSEALAWLAFTRPDARSALARRKVWTLIPHLQEFLANWFVSVDHERTDQSQWIHTNIDVDEARDLALLVPATASRGHQADHPTRSGPDHRRHRSAQSDDSTW